MKMNDTDFFPWLSKPLNVKQDFLDSVFSARTLLLVTPLHSILMTSLTFPYLLFCFLVICINLGRNCNITVLSHPPPVESAIGQLGRDGRLQKE